MTTLWRRGFVLVLAAASLAAMGCGGGGGDGGRVNMLQTDIDELERLRDELTTAKTALERQVESEKTARQTAEDDLETARTNLTAATTRATTAEDDLETARTNLTAATTRATTAEDDLETERAAKMEAETNVAVLTERAAQLAERLRTAEADKTKAETDLAAAQETLKTAEATASTSLATANRRVMELTAEVRTLTAQVTTLRGDVQAARTRAETDLAEARKALEAAQTTASTELATARQEVTDLKRQVRTLTETAATLREELRTAKAQTAAATADDDDTHPGLAPGGDDDDDDDTPTPTTQRSTPATQSAEASQRAKNLEAAFGMTAAASTVGTTSPIAITVPTSGRLMLRSGSKTTTLGGTGIRSATITGTGAGTGKTVVYTDRELTRKLLKHYTPPADQADKTRIPLGTQVGSPGETVASGAISVNSKNWKVTHGVSTSLRGVHNDADPPVRVRPGNPTNPAARASYRGSLHGVPGTFVCGGPSCQIQLMPTYAGDEDDPGDSFALTMVTLTGDGGIFFKPTRSDATIPLYDGGPVGADGEYMVFGYWREDSAGFTQFNTFAAAVGAETLVTSIAGSSTFPLYYDGKAVGAYVERDTGATADTYRQGEFVATANLTATGASAITGRIHGFTATPVGSSAAPKTSRWVVELAESNEATLTLSGSAMGTGAWNYAFVPVGGGEAVSPAVVGTFDVRAGGLLSIVGAFGAEKRN